MNLYKHDAQEYVFAESAPSPEYWEVQMVREGDLPLSMSDEDIDEWLKNAQIVEGCWCGPLPKHEEPPL